MRVGLIARGEARGLGHMTREFYRHVEPDRTLLVDLGPLGRGFRVHHEWYAEGVTKVGYDGVRFSDEALVRRWIGGLDVLYTAETFYDWRIVNWCLEAGVRTVCHVMPEFYKHAYEPLPYPSAWWAPTSWRLEHLPPSTRVVPVPVATDRFKRAGVQPDGPVVFLHVVGKEASHDRAGTNVLTQALRRVSVPMRVVVRAQGPTRAPFAVPRCVDLAHETLGGDYWELYDGASVLVQPRRYGGLSLPLNEASAAGLGLVVPDTSPHREWAAAYIEAREFGTLVSGAGEITMYETNPRLLAGEMELLATDPARVEDLRAAAYAWALAHSWKKLAGLYLTELERVCQ